MIKFLLIFLISFSAGASNWMRLSELEKEKPVQGYQMEQDCRRGGHECFDVGLDLKIIHEKKYTLEPIYGEPKLSVDPCRGKVTCQKALEAKKCTNPKQKAYSDVSRRIVYCMNPVSAKFIKQNDQEPNSPVRSDNDIMGEPADDSPTK